MTNYGTTPCNIGGSLAFPHDTSDRAGNSWPVTGVSNQVPLHILWVHPGPKIDVQAVSPQPSRHSFPNLFSCRSFVECVPFKRLPQNWNITRWQSSSGLWA